MNARTRENIIEVCSVLAKQENLKVTLQETGKGALITGASVLIGGILAGPFGMAFGGTVSSIAVACKSRGKFKSVVEIINDMTPDQQGRLSEAVMKALTNIRPEELMGVLTLALTNTSVKDVILKELGGFLLKEFRLQITNC